jgi:hypothetical protein
MEIWEFRGAEWVEIGEEAEEEMFVNKAMCAVVVVVCLKV